VMELSRAELNSQDDSASSARDQSRLRNGIFATESS
jgi:hypothetical protein